MTHKATLILILTATLFVPATSFAKVKTTYHSNTAPGTYQTYAWAENDNAEAAAAFEAIQAGIDAELAALGFDRVETGGDLVLTVELSAVEETRTQITEIHPPPIPRVRPYAARHWYRWGLGYDLVRIDSYDVNTGTLSVELIDPAAGETVWTGEAEGNVRKSPEKNARKAAKAIGKMFRDFPIEAAAT